MTPSHIVSTVILLIIFIGLWKRRDMKIHIPAMLTAFVADVLLVLYIEWNRQAIEQLAESVAAPAGRGLLLFHIGVSLTTILLYAILTVLGFKILKGQRDLLKLHRNLGAVFLLFRLVNYVTSFMI